MDSFFTRYRNLLVLLAILLAQIVGLAVQVRRTGEGRVSMDAQDSSGVRLIRLWAESIVAPAERGIHDASMASVRLWQNYIDLRRVRQQNQDLQKTVDRLRLEQAELLDDARQGERLQAILDFQHRYIYTTVAAQAIGTSGSDRSRIFYLDKGSSDGLKPDMAVITADGIVGKVRNVFPHTAQVLVINDQTSGAGVILETTRIRGILTGNALGQLEIVGILADDRIKPGEKILTAGGDLIFPRGLPVGEVEKVVRDPDRDSFIDVIVKPAAHLDRLDELLVITSTQPRFPPEEQQDISASEASKGAEAVAMKDQLKASQIMAERLPGITDANAPAPPQTPGPEAAVPGQPQSQANPAPAEPPAPKLLQPQHVDRFSPNSAAPPSAKSNPAANQGDQPKPQQNKTQQDRPEQNRPERNP